MAQDISNKINEATNDVILQGKDIRNRIISSENEIKHHINDAEMCILEAIEGLNESIGNINIEGGGCNCDFSNYYTMNEIDAMFAELREDDALSKVTITLSTNISGIFETGSTKNHTVTLNVNNQGLNPEKFTVEIRKGGANDQILNHMQLNAESTIYTYTDSITATQTYYAKVTYTSSNPNKTPKTWIKTCSVNSYFLTYYGFGTRAEDVFDNGVSMLVSTSLKNDQNPYEMTYNGDDVVNFYLLVPSGVSKSSIGAFKMGGSPVDMSPETSITHTNSYNRETNYIIQKTNATYEKGAKIKIYNS